MGLDGPEDLAVRLGAHSDCPAGLGSSGLAEGEKSQADAEDQGMGQSQDADVCAGGRICADSALVDSGRAAFGEDYVHVCDASGTAGAGFLECNPGCLRFAVCQFGNAGHAAWPRQGAERCEPGNDDPGAEFDDGGLVVDVD